MKQFFSLLLLIFLFACSAPSSEVIQTAIAKTENAQIPDTAIQTAIAKTQQFGTQPATKKSSTPTSYTNQICNLSSPIKNEWKTIICDTFDSDLDWWTGAMNDMGLEIRIEGGKYIIDYKSLNTQDVREVGYVQNMQIGEAKDYVVSLTGRIKSANINPLWGLIVRGILDDGYLFFIDNYGNYSLSNLGYADDYIGNIKHGSHNAIHWDQENTITILVEGEDLSFYVNGKLITTQEANNSARKEISWAFWGIEGNKMIYEFDNLLIKQK